MTPPDKPAPPEKSGHSKKTAHPNKVTGESPVAVLVRGDDPSLVGQTVRDVVAELVGDQDPGMVVEEHTELTSDTADAGAIVDALSTPPFLTDRRVVVVREAGRISSAEAGRIVDAIADPVPGVVLVVATGGGTLATVLANAIAKCGQVIDTKVGTGRARTQWLSEKLKDSPVKLDPDAAAHLGEHIGEDLGRLDGLLDSLASAYGESARISFEDLEPFLGAAGGVAPWDLTDSLDAGDSQGSLRALERLSMRSGSAPLVVLATLHRHYGSMLRLDGAEVTSPSEAAELLGSRSEFVARKALEQSRRLGSERIGRAIMLIAQADLDLRGRTGLPEMAVLQVLVARLSRLAPAARRPAARRR
jgi:DNA polymerase III subunit delta